jgi:hypothetical protein
MIMLLRRIACMRKELTQVGFIYIVIVDSCIWKLTNLWLIAGPGQLHLTRARF